MIRLKLKIEHSDYILNTILSIKIFIKHSQISVFSRTNNYLFGKKP